MTTSTQQATSSPHGWIVGIAVVGGVAAWAGRFALGYLLVPTACQTGTWVLHLVHAVFLLLVIGAVLLSVTLLRRSTDTATRFLLLLGLTLNSFFLATILLESSAVFVVDACAKGAIP